MPLKIIKKKATETYWADVFDKTMFEKSIPRYDDPRFILSKNYLLRNIRILEGGCGNGGWVYFLHELGYDVVGLDYAEKVIRRLHIEILNRKIGNLSLIIGDITHLCFKNKSFDIYLSLGVVEHFEEGPIDSLRECNRVLKMEGVLLLQVPYYNLIRRFKYLKNIKIEDSGQEFYQYAFTKREIKNYLEKTGFEIIMLTPVDIMNGLRSEFKSVIKMYSSLKGSMRNEVSKEAKANSGQNNHSKVKSKVIFFNVVKSVLKLLIN